LGGASSKGKVFIFKKRYASGEIASFSEDDEEWYEIS